MSWSFLGAQASCLHAVAVSLSFFVGGQRPAEFSVRGFATSLGLCPPHGWATATALGNGDPRAGYALEHGGGLTFHFVAYDVARVLADLKRIGLPEVFLQRWTNFVRTGFDVEWSREYQPGNSP